MSQRCARLSHYGSAPLTADIESFALDHNGMMLEGRRRTEGDPVIQVPGVEKSPEAVRASCRLAFAMIGENLAGHLGDPAGG